MKFREHRGGLSESLETQREIPATAEAAALEASRVLGRHVEPSEIRVQACGYDARIMWQTFLLFVEGDGPFGYCDEQLPGVPEARVVLTRPRKFGKATEAELAGPR
jgi:hypothetical protein